MTPKAAPSPSCCAHFPSPMLWMLKWEITSVKKQTLCCSLRFKWSSLTLALLLPVGLLPGAAWSHQPLPTCRFHSPFDTSPHHLHNPTEPPAPSPAEKISLEYGICPCQGGRMDCLIILFISRPCFQRHLGDLSKAKWIPHPGGAPLLLIPPGSRGWVAEELPGEFCGAGQWGTHWQSVHIIGWWVCISHSFTSTRSKLQNQLTALIALAWINLWDKRGEKWKSY